MDLSSLGSESVLISLSFSLIFLFGTVGNTLVLAVLIRGGQLNSKTTYLFILNLGVADLSFLVFCIPFQASIYALDRWMFGAALCKLVHFLIFLTMFGSIFTLTAVSLDRYLAICYPLHSREMRTPKNAITSICLVWALTLVFSAPYLSHFSQMDLAGTVVCIPAWESKPRFIMDLCTFIFGYLIPVLVLGLTYTRTIRYLWTSVDPVKDMSESRRAKKKVTKMVIIVAALFCVCWLPHHLVILCMWFGHFPLNHTTYVLCILSHLVAYANSCLNPIVHTLVSKHFRKGFRKVFSCSLKRREVNMVHVVQAVNTVVTATAVFWLLPCALCVRSPPVLCVCVRECSCVRVVCACHSSQAAANPCHLC
ncbi:galanin receptor 2a-like [Acanthochromis polyacanthus]|uniref:galanin receptor 2a-like n=1 Tax=Acanthochromis polyacanthus TaxID=80966 RepID=UPI0022348A7D|nr:galanin receptor 2a-like [Acanthochromis polyacanthus]